MTGFRRRRKEVLAAILLLTIVAAIASLPSIPQALAAARSSHFAQAPLPAALSFSFGAAGDIGANDNATAALDALAGAETSFFLALGDLSYNEMRPESAWCAYVQQHVGATYPFEVLVGNHEETATSKGGYIDNFAACLPDRLGASGQYAHQYYFDYPPDAPLARFILIDPAVHRGANKVDYCTGGDTANCDWLKARIDEAQNRGLWTIVGMHKNCITMGEKSCEIGAPLLNVLVERKVDLILQGHDHGYQRSKQLGLGTACTALAPNAYNADCVIDDGTDGAYARGAGPVLLILAKSGRDSYPINPSDSEAPYFSTWMHPDNNSFGFMQFTVSASSIDAHFVAGIGTSSDHFTIGGTAGAADTAGGGAPQSISAAQTVTITAAADAYVTSNEPSTNFGTDPRLRLDNSPTATSYLRFNVQGLAGQVATATLNVYANSSSKDGYAVSSVSDNNWTETDLTYATAPAVGAPVDSSGAVASKTWTQVDVTALVTGTGTLDLAMLAASKTGIVFSSREGTNPPVLIVTTAAQAASAVPAP